MVWYEDGEPETAEAFKLLEVPWALVTEWVWTTESSLSWSQNIFWTFWFCELTNSLYSLSLFGLGLLSFVFKSLQKVKARFVRFCGTKTNNMIFCFQETFLCHENITLSYKLIGIEVRFELRVWKNSIFQNSSKISAEKDSVTLWTEQKNRG